MTVQKKDRPRLEGGESVPFPWPSFTWWDLQREPSAEPGRCAVCEGELRGPRQETVTRRGSSTFCPACFLLRRPEGDALGEEDLISLMASRANPQHLLDSSSEVAGLVAGARRFNPHLVLFLAHALIHHRAKLERCPSLAELAARVRRNTDPKQRGAVLLSSKRLDGGAQLEIWRAATPESQLSSHHELVLRNPDDTATLAAIECCRRIELEQYEQAFRKIRTTGDFEREASALSRWAQEQLSL